MVKTFFCSLTFFLFTSLFLFYSPVLAQTPQKWSTRCAPLIQVPGSSKPYDDVASLQGFECLFYNILQIVVGIAGLAFFAMFITGGFKYLFSAGDSKKAASASSTLTLAIIGLIGVIASWFIIYFIEKITGVDITNFVIPGGK